MKTALIVVDLQNDFLPGGALAVKGGDAIIPIINRLLKLSFDVKVATKDWHPKDHGSFASVHGKIPSEHVQLKNQDQILWPDHCIQHSLGANFADELAAENIDCVFYKGVDKDIDSYSAFFDNAHLKSTGLYDYLKERGVEEIFIAGLATDYCVKYSVLDALALGFKTHVIVDACKAVNLSEHDGEEALEEMKRKGVTLNSSKDIVFKK